MPPALSDESSDNELPATRPVDDANQDDANDDDAEEEEDEFVVEKIVGHRFNKGVLQFDVKWLGYEKAEDRTWEPESNLATAADVLHEYFDDIGGRPEPKGTKRKGRASMPDPDTATPTSTSKRSKNTKPDPASSKRPSADQPWSPPPGSWEHDVSHIDTVEQSTDPKTGKDAKYAYLVWKNQKKTQHPLRHVYNKCPQKMLAYYESHLVFTVNDANGDTMHDSF